MSVAGKLLFLGTVVLALLSCTRSGGVEGGTSGVLLAGKPGGDAETVYGIRSQLTYENARLRCSFSDEQENRYRVYCEATTIDTIGNETRATSMAPDVQLRWESPQQLSGSPVTSISCTNGQFQQQCLLTLASDSLALMGFHFQLQSGSESRTEQDQILFPYSAQSIGFSPQLPRTFIKPQAKTDTSMEESVGFQSQEMDPLLMPLSYFQYACAAGERLYFSSNNFIYVSENGKARIFAGSPNPANVDEYSHRLRIFLRNFTGFACSETAVFINDVDRNRILKLSDTGPVTFLNAPPPGIDFDPNRLPRLTDGRTLSIQFARGIFAIDKNGTEVLLIGKLPALNPNGMNVADYPFGNVNSVSLSEDGGLYVLEGNSRILKVTPQNTLQQIPDRTFNQPQYLLDLPDHSLLVIDGYTVLRRAPTGQLTRVVEALTAPRAIAGTLNALYIADGNAIRKFSPEGLVTIAGGDSPGFSGDGGPAAQALLNEPWGIAVLKDGSLIFSDRNNDRVRKIDSAGKITTIAGGGSMEFVGNDGLATQFKLNHPTQVVADRSGRIYFTDRRKLFLLKPNANGSYTLSLFVGTHTPKDCGTGIIERSSTTRALDTEIKAALSTLCQGKPTALSIQDTCDQPNGSITLLYSQLITYTTTQSNVMKVTRPCDF